MFHVEHFIGRGGNMDYNLYLVDAFTDEIFKGNPACVIPYARGLSEDQMKKIAGETQVSETVFVEEIDRGNYEIRYFSPYGEERFCGHSTVAIFYILALRGYIGEQETGVKTVHISSYNNKIDVDIYFEDYDIKNVMVNMGEPESTGKLASIDSTLEALNLSREDLALGTSDGGIPIVKLYSKYALLPIRSKEALDKVDMSSEKLTPILEEHDINGVHLFYLPEGDKTRVYTRNFSITGSAVEEPATGTANGCLAYFLKKEGMIDGNKVTSIQGEQVNRKSVINCVIKEKKGIYKVEVGGKAKVVIEGIIHVDN